MLDEIIAIVNAILTPIIVCIAVIKVLNKIFSYLDRQNKLQIQNKRIEKQLEELSQKNSDLSQKYQKAIASLESKYMEALDHVTAESAQLEQYAESLLKNTSQITVLHKTLSEHIHGLSEYLSTPTEEKESVVKERMQAAIAHIEEINQSIAEHSAKLDEEMHKIILRELQEDQEEQFHDLERQNPMKHEMGL